MSLGLPGGSIDEPTSGAPIPRVPTYVRGWALLDRSPVARVRILLNGRPVGLARLGTPRPDVAELTTAPEAPVCGFEHVLNLATEGPLPQELRIEAEVEGVHGERHGLPPVTVEVTEQPIIGPTAPWAADGLPRGAPAGSRLLVLSHSFSRDGASLSLLELLRGIAARGVDVTVVGPPGQLEGAMRSAGFAVRTIDGFPIENPDAYVSWVEELEAWAAPQRFGILLANGTPTFAGVDLAVRLGIPSVIRMSGGQPLTVALATMYAPTRMHPWIVQRALSAFRTADRVVFASEAARRLFIEGGSVPASRARVVRVAVDLPAIERGLEISRRDARHQLGLDQEAVVALAVGAVVPLKGQAVLARALAITRRGQDVTLMLLGSDRNVYADGIRSFVDRVHLSCRLEGEVEVAWPWYRAADLLVCASDSEGWPRAVLEGMAFGLPVVTTRVSDLSTVLEEGRTGFLCRPRDVADLAAALDRALALSSAERRSIGEAGRSLAQHLADPDRAIRELHAILTEVWR